ncbi:MAG: sulfatase [Acidobacteria bacterium]|nr:sulfatase [Acidobacteriota bacterium]
MTVTRRAALAAPFLNLRAQNKQDRPNILWILGDDLGPQLRCYGHKLVSTPNVDRIAAEGARFTHCFTTAPVCSPSRSGWNTGVYQTTTGAHNHRSHRKDGYKLPEGVRLVSHRLHDAGYFTANVTDMGGGLRASGKTDFNFEHDKPFDGTHWNQRAKGQPFYAQINFTAPHKGPIWPLARKQKSLVDPARVELPPYYPDHPTVRDEVANYFDAVNYWDTQVGQVMENLKKDGLLENTVIFVFGDNGRCLLRGKQWLYDPGTHVPLLVRWPDRVKAGTVRKDPVISLDITATTLDAAGIEHPKLFHGQSLFGKAKPRTEIFTARDRCDMTVDRIRAVRDARYKLIHNFYPDRSYAQFNQYIKTSYPTLTVLEDLGKQGKLNDLQARWWAPSRPEFELYDHQADPHEVNNLAAKPEHKKTLDRLSKRLDKWIADTNDQGRTPETRETIEREEPRAVKG